VSELRDAQIFSDVTDDELDNLVLRIRALKQEQDEWEPHNGRSWPQNGARHLHSMEKMSENRGWGPDRGGIVGRLREDTEYCREVACSAHLPQIASYVRVFCPHLAATLLRELPEREVNEVAQARVVRETTSFVKRREAAIAAGTTPETREETGVPNADRFLPPSGAAVAAQMEVYRSVYGLANPNEQDWQTERPAPGDRRGDAGTVPRAASAAVPERTDDDDQRRSVGRSSQRAPSRDPTPARRQIGSSRGPAPEDSARAVPTLIARRGPAPTAPTTLPNAAGRLPIAPAKAAPPTASVPRSGAGTAQGARWSRQMDRFLADGIAAPVQASAAVQRPPVPPEDDDEDMDSDADIPEAPAAPPATVLDQPPAAEPVRRGGRPPSRPRSSAASSAAPDLWANWRGAQWGDAGQGTQWTDADWSAWGSWRSSPAAPSGGPYQRQQWRTVSPNSEWMWSDLQNRWLVVHMND
jgi:hypothetical protein